MEDDDGIPLLADDIIPILTSEVSLGFNDDNPYNLLNAEKGKHMYLHGNILYKYMLFTAPEPVTRNISNTNTSKLNTI